jgi:hypothetical protein
VSSFTSTSTGIVLNDAAQNPATVDLGAVVTNTDTASYNGDGIFGSSITAWTLTNLGSIDATAGSHSTGVNLAAGGEIINGGTDLTDALIAGNDHGVYIAGTAGTVVNFGTIEHRGAGTVGLAVVLRAGGSVANYGLISGGRPGTTNSYGAVVNVQTATGTVRNFGTITNSYLTNGVNLAFTGGTVINGSDGSGGTAATIAAPHVGVYIGGGGGVATPGAIGTVVNYGTIKSTFNGAGVALASGGTVTNRAGGLIASYNNGVLFKNTAGTVVNFGTIQNTTTANFSAVLMGAGGLVTNGAATATNARIESNLSGVSFGTSVAGTIVNFGTIAAVGTASRSAVYLGAGGTLTNGDATSTAALITSDNNVGVALENAPGTIVNFGTIESLGTHSGVNVGTSGLLENYGLITGKVAGLSIGQTFATSATVTAVNAGTIVGPIGLQVGANNSGTSTIVNSGTIVGSNGTAVVFAGSGTNLLALGNGYQLTGVVVGGVSSDTLELLGSAGNSLTVDYNALGLSNFETVLFGTSGYNTLRVSNTTGTLSETIAGFDQTTEIIDLTGISNGTISNFDSVNNLITVSGIGGSVAFQLDNSDATLFRTAPDGGGGTELIACFARGTLILTENGEVAVEHLAIGDSVVTLSGAQAIRWVGRRSYDGRFIAGNRNVLPICIKASAIMRGVPARDLWVSPEHSLLIDNVLVQAKHLVNGSTIVQPDSVEQVEYFHIELESHDVIYADGAPAETFVDCDNRLMFTNGAEYARLYPDDERPRWHFCAPRLEWGSAELIAIRSRIFDHACQLGHAAAGDFGLHLVSGGVVQPPMAVTANIYRFELDGASREVWIASHSFVPAEREAASRDIRRLGVPLERIILSDVGLSIEVSHSHSAFCDGFHADEESHRWTDGCARIPDVLLRPFNGPIFLEVRLATAQSDRQNPLNTINACLRP